MNKLDATLKGIDSYIKTSNNIIWKNIKPIRDRNLLKANYLVSILKDQLREKSMLTHSHQITELSQLLTVLIGSPDIDRDTQLEKINDVWRTLFGELSDELVTTNTEISTIELIPSADASHEVKHKYYLYLLGVQLSGVLSPLGRCIEDYRNSYLSDAKEYLAILLNEKNFKNLISEQASVFLFKINIIIEQLLSHSYYHDADVDHIAHDTKKNELLNQLKHDWDQALNVITSRKKDEG